MLTAADTLPPRQVAFALELLDPVTARFVNQGIRVTVAGRDRPPIVNASGRFVWIGQPDVWPTTLSVAPGPHPFEPIENLDVTGQRPPTWPDVEPRERVVRVRLRPTARYSLGHGVTGVRGVLFAATPGVSPRTPIAGALVWFEWAVAGTADWQAIEPTAWVRTDVGGEFAVFHRIRGGLSREPDVARGKVRIRIVVRHGGAERRTPAGFAFLPAPADAGRVPEGIALTDMVVLAWDALA